MPDMGLIRMAFATVRGGLPGNVPQVLHELDLVPLVCLASLHNLQSYYPLAVQNGSYCSKQFPILIMEGVQHAILRLLHPQPHGLSPLVQAYIPDSGPRSDRLDGLHEAFCARCNPLNRIPLQPHRH